MKSIIAAAALALVPAFASAEIIYESTYYVPPKPDTMYYLQPVPRAYAYAEQQPEIRYYYPAERIDASSQRANEDDLITGRVATPGQKLRAENDTRGVDGVAEIHNPLRSAVGDY